MTEIDEQQRPSPFRKPLNERQLNRRRMMQGLAASGAVTTIAGIYHPSLAGAQATPSASPVATAVPAAYDGPLAAEQVMTLPVSEPTTMDPGVSYGDDEVFIFPNIFDGLVGVDTKTGDVVPRLAESWDISDDATQFIFHLRQGLTWSDGTPLNANDFVWSWKRVLDPNTLSQYMPAMQPIKNATAIINGEMEFTELGVSAVDDNTLQVDLEAPTTFFPLLASTWTFVPVPKHVIDDKGDEWVEAGNMVCNGPFVMTGWTHDQEMILEANPTYYGEAPTLTKATYKIFSDPGAQAFVAFENGELDYCEPGGPDTERINSDASLADQILRFELSNCYFVVCDTSNVPTDQVAFRQALSKSISRSTLADTIFKGEYVAAYNLLPANIPGNNPNAMLPESVDEAKQLLADAGIDPSTITIDFTFLNLEFNTTVAQYLQSAWQDGLGITVTMNPIEDSTYSDWRASRETETYGVYTGSWGSDFADASNWFNQNFTTTADHYRNHWSNPEFDTLVETAVSNLNTEERKQQYSDAEVILINDAAIIPFLRGVALRLVKPWVKDLYLQPILSVPHLRTIKIAEH